MIVCKITLIILLEECYALDFSRIWGLANLEERKRLLRASLEAAYIEKSTITAASMIVHDDALKLRQLGEPEDLIQEEHEESLITPHGSCLTP